MVFSRVLPALSLFLAALAVSASVPAGHAGAMAAALKADRIVVHKERRQLLLLRGGKVLREYRVALGRYPEGRKTRAGDARTPEGVYHISGRLDRDRSRFHRALQISYPDWRDRDRAEALGVHPGGNIMIHGLPLNWTARQLNHPEMDWTQGCIGVTNREMDEIWSLVDDGTTIDIRP